jgi:hypothetical protein
MIPGVANGFDDRIITLQNEAIACYIFSNPKELLRELRKATYYYNYIVVKFKNDSVRVYAPGSIKGCCQTSDVNRQMLASWYVSDSINANYDAVSEKKTVVKACFVYASFST